MVKQMIIFLNIKTHTCHIMVMIQYKLVNMKSVASSVNRDSLLTHYL